MALYHQLLAMHAYKKRDYQHIKPQIPRHNDRWFADIWWSGIFSLINLLIAEDEDGWTRYETSSRKYMYRKWMWNEWQTWITPSRWVSAVELKCINYYFIIRCTHARDTLTSQDRMLSANARRCVCRVHGLALNARSRDNTETLLFVFRNIYG